jgi:hypothetical protein
MLRKGELGQAGGGTCDAALVVGSTAVAGSTTATSTAATKLVIPMASLGSVILSKREWRRPKIAG